jgi:hypothetical protein
MLLDGRYHVGRHVANLQVTNTYEGTNVGFFFVRQLVFPLTVFGVGYPRPYFGESIDWYPGLCELKGRGTIYQCSLVRFFSLY